MTRSYDDTKFTVVQKFSGQLLQDNQQLRLVDYYNIYNTAPPSVKNMH